MTTAAHLIPYIAMPGEAWSRMEHAADDPSHPMRLVVMATITPDVRPAARTLVLRGADRRGARLWFHTDIRSAKVAQIRTTPLACAIAYDRRDGVQLHMDGRVSVHSGDALADSHWAQTDMAVRFSYALATPPGAPVTEADPRAHVHHLRLDKGREEDGRRHFAVLQMIVDSIEWFQTTTSGQCRAIMHSREGWAASPLAP